MKIKVISVIPEKDEMRVVCTTPYGKATVQWKSEVPTVNFSFDIELEIEEDLIWGKNILSSKDGEFVFEDKNGILSICGIFESIDDDGYGILRMGDGIIPFFAIGNSFDVGVSIEINAKNISAYSVNY